MKQDEISLELPKCFRVIGIGETTAEIINRVHTLGYEGVSCTVITYPFECIPTDEDRMVIIVARDLEEHANRIARSFKDAGVLTLGLLYDADICCYDSVITGASFEEFPDVIKSILHPVVSPGFISYTFYDLNATLRDTDCFMVRNVVGKGVKDVVAKMQNEFTSISFEAIENLTLHLYFNPLRPDQIRMKEVTPFSEMVSSLPESVNIIWSLNFDELLAEKHIRLTSILAGKEIENV